MRNLLIILLLLSPMAAELSLAQTSPITIVCEACRDPIEYPDDFVNFGFNQVYGPDAWLDFEQADDFYLINLAGDLVYVDIDYLFLGIGFKGLRLPFWPTNKLQITLALPNGKLYVAIRSTFLTSLPVPASPDNEPDDAGSNDGAGSHGGGEADDDYNADIDEWEDPDFEENIGVTGIEDPDEDGEFEEPEWCEEC